MTLVKSAVSSLVSPYFIVRLQFDWVTEMLRIEWSATNFTGTSSSLDTAVAIGHSSKRCTSNSNGDGA